MTLPGVIVAHKRIIQSKSVADTNAPYSQATVFESMIFVAGQIAYDAQTGSVIEGTIKQECRMALENMTNILEEAGSDRDKVLKVTVFLTDINDFSRFNEIYREFFGSNAPARSCVEVSRLPFGARVEVEAIAHL
jgi:2-iminobutanoate/2-iminopropanoate deaminase